MNEVVENKLDDKRARYLFRMANLVSNTGHPLTDNDYGRELSAATIRAKSSVLGIEKP